MLHYDKFYYIYETPKVLKISSSKLTTTQTKLKREPEMHKSNSVIIIIIISFDTKIGNQLKYR